MVFACFFSGLAARGRIVASGLLSAAGLSVVVLVTGCLGGVQSRGQGLEEAKGRASYYGDKFAGETTASGEPFDPDAMTAAHPRLPFDTVVRVTRIDGKERSVVVRINDRGPFVDGRIIDLSEAAARELGMIREGVVEVRVEVLEQSGAPEDPSAERVEHW